MGTTQPNQLQEHELEAAFKENRFELHYQPQITSRENRLVGVEGLVRLRARNGVLIPPSCFVQTLEQTGLVNDVGLSLFEQGCLQAKMWPCLSVAVNVSPAQFRNPDIVRCLTSIAQRVGVDPKQIEIEITEGLFFEDPERAEVALRSLHKEGFGIALDDFGTGYSSLGYLLRFPVSKIKIDQSFVKALPHDIKSASIIHALVALGRALGLKVVAEGVETDAQRVFLRAAGCHQLQGYFFAPALQASDVSQLLNESGTLAGEAKRALPGP